MAYRASAMVCFACLAILAAPALLAGEFDLYRDSTPVANGATDNLGGGWPEQMSSYLTYRITNSGSTDLAIYDISPVVTNQVNCSVGTAFSAYSPIPAGYTATPTLTVNPQASGTFSFTLSVGSDDSNENPYVWNVTGQAVTGTPELDISYNSSALNDGSSFTLVESFQAGIPTNVTFTLTNSGSANLTFYGAAGCTQWGNCMWSPVWPTSPIAPSTSVSLIVSITPSSAGFFYLYNYRLQSTDQNESPYNWDMSATAATPAAPEIQISWLGGDVPDGSYCSYGGPAAGSPYVFDLQIANAGNQTLTVTTPVANPGSQTNCSASVTTQPASSVSPAGSTNVQVTVTPTAAGFYSCQLVINSNDSDENPYNISLEGSATAVAPEINVQRSGGNVGDGATDNVGTQAVGTPLTFTYSIQNLGSANLTLTLPVAAPSGATNCSASISGQPSSATIAPSGSATLTVQVTVSTAAAFSCVVTVQSDDADEATYNWTISGTGSTSLPEMAVEAFGGVPVADGGTHPFSGNAAQGIESVHSFTVRNTGTVNLDLSGSPEPWLFSNQVNCTARLVSFSGTTVLPGDFEVFNVGYEPNSTGAFSFEVTIPNNDPDENPYNFVVTGNAIDPNGGGGGGGGDGGGGGGGCSTSDNLAWLPFAAACAALGLVSMRRWRAIARRG